MALAAGCPNLLAYALVGWYLVADERLSEREGPREWTVAASNSVDARAGDAVTPHGDERVSPWLCAAPGWGEEGEG
jgi:hypothetical protein